MKKASSSKKLEKLKKNRDSTRKFLKNKNPQIFRVYACLCTVALSCASPCSSMSSTSSEDENKGSFKNRKTPQKKTCNLCQTEEIAELGSAALLEKDGIRAHYFCLLFSSGLGQKGDELEGLNGFLPGDVRKELKRGARLKCVHCKLKGATVGCAKAECKKSYHLPCGMKNGSLQEFFDQVNVQCGF